MKQLIALVLIMVIHSQSKAQYDHSFSLESIDNRHINEGSMHSFFSGGNDTKKDYDYYMKKRQKNKTIGWVLLGSGFAFTGIGALLGAVNNRENATGGAAAISLIFGAATGIASIPFMAIATANNHKAKVFLRSQQTGYRIPANPKAIPALALSMSLGK
jgi:hypothetical protein